MNIHVIKFGGSCLKEPSDGGYLVKALRNIPSDDIVIFVVSALFGVTAKLKYIWRHATQDKHTEGGPKSSIQTLYELKEFHKSFVDNPKVLEPFFKELDSLLKNHNKFMEPKFVSMGEQMSRIIIGENLKRFMSGGRTLSVVDAKDYIVTEGGKDPMNDKPVISLSEEKLLKLPLSPGAVIVFPGYYGAKQPSGLITLLSDNGSDITAAVIAQALYAKQLLFLKDVNGMYTADPHQDQSATLLPELSYKEARENTMKHTKAVLHPSTFNYIRDIPISIRNYQHPDPESPGTLIYG